MIHHSGLHWSFSAPTEPSLSDRCREKENKDSPQEIHHLDCTTLLYWFTTTFYNWDKRASWGSVPNPPCTM